MVQKLNWIKYSHVPIDWHPYNMTKCFPPYRSFGTRVSQLKICDFSGETFKGFEVL